MQVAATDPPCAYPGMLRTHHQKVWFDSHLIFDFQQNIVCLSPWDAGISDENLNLCAGHPGRTCDSPASDAAESLPVTKQCIIRVGDTVFAKSGVATCAGMAIGLVEDMWSGCADEVAKLAIPAAAPRIRLRWMLTIGNIAISRARLPRGSQASALCFACLVARCDTPGVTQLSVMSHAACFHARCLC